MALAVTFGDTAAIAAMRKTLADKQAPLENRQNALATLLKVRDAGLAPTLQSLVGDPALRSAALRGLASYDDPRTPSVIVEAYLHFNSGEKRDALATLGSRVDFTGRPRDSIHCARRRVWVVVPAPSTPSRTMSWPSIIGW